MKIPYCTLGSLKLEIPMKHLIMLPYWKKQPGLLGFFLLGVNHNAEKMVLFTKFYAIMTPINTQLHFQLK